MTRSPSKPAPPAKKESGKDAKIKAALAKLPDADRKLAEQQRFCAVLTTSPLGSMGAPVKVMVDGQPVFVCCEGCREEALDEDPAGHDLATVQKPKRNIDQRALTKPSGRGGQSHFASCAKMGQSPPVLFGH